MAHIKVAYIGIRTDVTVKVYYQGITIPETFGIQRGSISQGPSSAPRIVDHIEVTSRNVTANEYPHSDTQALPGNVIELDSLWSPDSEVVIIMDHGIPGDDHKLHFLKLL